MSESNAAPKASDEEVSQFLAVTGTADPSQATSYLEMSGGDLQTAVGLFMEHQHGGGGGAAGAGRTRVAGNGAGTGAEMGRGGMGMEDDIRAPDETRNMRLMDFDDEDGGDLRNGVAAGIFGPGGLPNGTAGMMNEFMGNAFAADLGDDSAANVIIQGNFRDVINRAAAVEASSGGDAASTSGVVVPIDVDLDAEADATTSTRTAPTPSDRARRLGEMFEAPTHLIYNRGGFQGARNVAKDARRWLLVNIQSDADFACHALNRDVWKDELVENLIREGFIFWQTANTTRDGQTYVQHYNVTGYPHIAIIDPRTGRRMWMKEGWTAENPLTPQMFAEQATDFCSGHSFDKAPTAPRTSLTKEISTSSASGVDDADVGSSSGNVVERMTEEQQLQAAIRASMNTASHNNTNSDDDDDDDDDDVNSADSYVMEIDDVSEDDDRAKIPSLPLEEETKEEPKQPTFEETIASMNVSEEPSGTDGVARIMIRMPDGKRLVRKFLLADTVKVIYAFIAQSNEDAKSGKMFECKFGFPPKNLLASVDDTIGKCGLAGETITVRWKD